MCSIFTITENRALKAEGTAHAVGLQVAFLVCVDRHWQAAASNSDLLPLASQPICNLSRHCQPIDFPTGPIQHLEPRYTLIHIRINETYEFIYEKII